MNRHVNAISGRLSLRKPQRDSLEILAHVADVLPMKNGGDLPAMLETIRLEYPTVTDFERDFPSLCFALATGVGKTRLMGAFIAYLHLAKGIRHFFVLAPNLTIYNKLIKDFTPNHSKYVFQGIAEFAQTPPEIITGDNYESGRGVRSERAKQTALGVWGDDAIHINVFNISKINSEVRGGKAPKIKRLSEYIGQSYFDYLAELDDLVLIMDESHRYRASAGVKAINDLKPILGLELTATPQVESGGRPVPFNNIIYSYPLANALTDGFVKEPAVATRENFDAKNYTEEQLEQLKLEDGVRIHENTKVELEVYARQNGKPIVKPFMLVVAQDTGHADRIVEIFKADSFFEGRYKDKIITVHSNQRGEESEETVARLLAVEDPAEPTEIVVHVNMLKEGWDVTNLYTIVPLRAGRSKTLVEQSIGRGLRLPYAKRVGVPAVDRLTIVAHEMFQQIIDEANNPNSIIRTGIVIGRDIPMEGKKTIVSQPNIVERITASGTYGSKQENIIFKTPAEQDVAKITLEAIKKFEKLPRSYDLKAANIQEQIVREVTAVYTPSQQVIDGTVPKVDIAKVVAETTDQYVELTIDIPRIVVVPKGEVSCGFNDFNLNTSGINLQPVSEDILIQLLRTHEREKLNDGSGIAKEDRLENYIVRALIDFDDISYDDQAELLYKLAGQLVAHLESYLQDVEAVKNVLQYNQKRLADLIHAQMQDHYWEKATSYEAQVSKGFVSLRENSYTALTGENARNFRMPVVDKLKIPGMIFIGFKKCLYQSQKFGSDTERKFTVILEDDGNDVLKWFKPGKDQFKIYSHKDQSYEPDFVVETTTGKFLCETKAVNEIDSPDVQAKKKAAVEWCKYASEHEIKHGGKPWSYVLIPHDGVSENNTFSGIVSMYTQL